MGHINTNEIITLRYDKLIDDLETDRAWCFVIDHRMIFLPKSLVQDINEIDKEVDVPQWLVEKEGLESYEV